MVYTFYILYNFNTRFSRNLWKWCTQNKVRFIYASSAATYGDGSKGFDDSENKIYEPLNIYGLSKYLFDRYAIKQAKKYLCPPQWVGLKFFNVYGPNESLDEIHGNVIGIWQSKVKKGLPLPIVGDGNQRRDFTHVIDIVSGLIKIAFSDICHNDGWELGTGMNYSINELYNMFYEKFDMQSINIPDQKGNYKLTLRENDDMLSKLDWKPKDRLKDHISNLKL